MFTAATILLAGAASLSGVVAQDGVFATGPVGKDNPKPTMGSAINQASMSRISSLNSIDDWCVFAPATMDEVANVEGEVVSYCTKARNGARIIPDGTITGLSFLKTDMYVQLMGYGDFSKINIKKGDTGGELDPHGAEGTGNPIGGDVVVNINGEDKYIKEWMMYMAADSFCFRACINANSTFSAAQMCEHKLDVMGCEFVMPGNYDFKGRFETCDAQVAYPPGWYPKGDGTFSQFEQYWTGVVNGQTFTAGDLTTPAAPAMTPSSSNCKTTSTVGNGIATSLLAAGATGPVPTNEAATQAGAAVTGNVDTSATGTTSKSGTTAKATGQSVKASGTGASAAQQSGGSNGALSSAATASGLTLVAIVATIAGISVF